MPPNASRLYSDITTALFSNRQRSFSLQKMGAIIQSRSRTLCRKRETLEHSTLNGMSSLNPSPQRAQETLWKSRQNECKSQRSQRRWRMRRKQKTLTTHELSEYELTKTDKHVKGLHRSASDLLCLHYGFHLHVFMIFFDYE